MDVTKAGIDNADLVIAQVNENMPVTQGNSFVSVRDIDYLVPYTEPLLEFESPKISERSRQIGEYAAKIIENESTISVGIDAISISSGVVRDNKYIYANTIESMCISAPIYSGNSGSPIVNKNGEVIGIISYGVGDNEAVSSISWGCSSSIMQLICTQIIANNQNFVGKSINARLYPVDSHYLISRGKYNYALEGYYAHQSSEPALTRLQHIITHINGKHLGVYYNQDTPTKEVYLNLGGAITARIVDGNTGHARDVSLPLTYISAATDIPLGSGADSDINIHRIGPIKKDIMI